MLLESWADSNQISPCCQNRLNAIFGPSWLSLGNVTQSRSYATEDIPSIIRINFASIQRVCVKKQPVFMVNNAMVGWLRKQTELAISHELRCFWTPSNPMNHRNLWSSESNPSLVWTQFEADRPSMGALAAACAAESCQPSIEGLAREKWILVLSVLFFFKKIIMGILGILEGYSSL